MAEGIIYYEDGITACFRRICEEAKRNQEVIPFSYFVEGDSLWCEREGMNPSIYAQREGTEWIAFFERGK